MSDTSTKRRRALPSVWRWEDGYGALGSRDADKRQIIAEWLNEAEGATLDVLNEEDIVKLESEMYFLVLRSVVKADHHFLDPDECGGFHSEASGRRTLAAWFIDAVALRAVLDEAIERRVADCEETPAAARDTPGGTQ